MKYLSVSASSGTVRQDFSVADVTLVDGLHLLTKQRIQGTTCWMRVKVEYHSKETTGSSDAKTLTRQSLSPHQLGVPPMYLLTWATALIPDLAKEGQTTKAGIEVIAKEEAHETHSRPGCQHWQCDSIYLEGSGQLSRRCGSRHMS